MFIMEIKSVSWPLPTFKLTENQINPQPTYQRSSVWKKSQKQMLIDSIIRQIDIPKIYLRQLPPSSPFKYEIIDGQQRMRTIWEFMDVNGNGFELSDECDDIIVDGRKYDISGCKYNEIPTEVDIDRIQKYTLDVVIIQNATEDEIADLFYRLNNGTPLSPAEVRNSMPGLMTSTVREKSQHHFFQKVNFINRRFAHDQVCAMMLLIELKGLTDTRDRELTKMYDEFSKSIPSNSITNLNNTLNVLNKIFPTKSKALNRVPTINLYIIISYLLKTHKLKDEFYKEFYDWYMETEPIRLKNPEYRLFMQSSANSINSIEGRLKILFFDFYSKFSSMAIVQLDPKRNFDEQQKLEIYARDKGVCQKCFKKVPETNWHADHKIPWIKGGKTVIENGQVLCIKDNLSKKDKLW